MFDWVLNTPLGIVLLNWYATLKRKQASVSVLKYQNSEQSNNYSRLQSCLLLTDAVSHRCSEKKTIPRNFTKFTGQHMCSSFFDKVGGGRSAILPKTKQVQIPQFLLQTEIVNKRCSVRKVFLKNFQNSQENNCTKKKTLVSFPVNFSKFFRAAFYRTPPSYYV